MRRDKDIIGYMYTDTEQSIRNKVAEEIEEVYKWAKTPEIRAIAEECANIARYGIEIGVGE